MKAIDVMTRNDNAAPEAVVLIVINARIDIYLKQIGDPASRFAETVRRAEAYLAAGPIASSPLRSPTLTRSAD
jgi:2-methylisocitrate lyase-like PEP mutase family enzyme